MKRHDLFRLVRIFSLTLLWAGAATVHLSAQCTGEVLNISAPTHSTSGTTANWTVPSGGPYKVKITTKGAKGGAGISNGTSYPGSKGATMVGEFIVLAGQNIQTVAGAPGGDAIISADGGGGGGTSVRIGSGSLLLVAGGGGGGSQQTSSQGGQVGSGNGQGGAGNIGAGGGGLLSAGGAGFTNGNGNAPTGGGAGFNATGGLGRVNSYVSGNGGGGFGGGGGGNTLGFGGGGGGGYTGGVGGSVISFITTGGGGSYNVGANQNNTADANNAGGQVIIECLGAATFTATVTPMQPICSAPTQGSLSIDLTGDNNGNIAGLEYAIVAGSSFTGTPTFANITADPFNITSGFGTMADLDGETYTIRIRLKYNPTIFIDQTYTLTTPSTSGAATWTGNFNTDWHNPCNWNNNALPSATSDVTIPDVANDPTISAAAVAKSVTVNSGAVLSITAMGSLTINGFTPTPISSSISSALINAGTITNSGILDVGSGSSAGWSGVYNSNTINNNAGGLFRINNTSEYAFWNTSNATIMVNAGMLEIGGIAAVGIGIANQGAFTNTLSGEISINNAAMRGILNFNAPGFTNFGTITIGANGNVGEFAIRSSSTPVANSGCSALIKVLSNSIIFNNGSTVFTNSGTIIENASGTSNITNNSGTVQNLNGGTFSITNNTGVLTTATGDIWTGCTSTDWHTATNWHDGTVPTATDDVTIPDVTNDPIISAVAVAKSVAVDANASLTIAAASSLTIEGSTGFPSGGMYNLGTVTNNGMILAGPNTSPGQYGIVNEATFNNNAGAEVKIDRTSNMGFWNRTTAASLTNSGTITIGGTADINAAGLYNEGNVQNTGGEIRIDRFKGAGLHNLSNSTVTNSGKIMIGKTAFTGSAPGIFNFGHIQNLTTGEIEVDRTTSGIYNTTLNIINSSFTNEGKIAIGQTAAVSGPGIFNYPFATGLISFENKTSGEILLDRTQTGIENNNNCTIDNSGLIKIGTTGALTGLHPGIYNLGTFNNKASAEIRIDAVPQSGLDNRATFTNGGKIIVGINVTNTSYNPGVYNGATFVNQVNAELRIDRFSRTGFYNSNSSSLTNAGLIKIGENVLGGENGLYNAGTVNNQADGEIHVDNIPNANKKIGVHNDDNINANFTNTGKMFIGTAVSAGSTGLYNGGTFSNSGEIRVDNVRGTSERNGLLNDFAFTNTGKITLGGSATAGDWGLYNTSTFNNNTGGEISIDRCNITGLRNESGTFTSNGSIALGGIANIGSWGLWNQSAFNNNTGGEISIDRTSNTGLFIYSNTFTNNGAVSIGAATAVGDRAIYNQSTLTNGACAQLNIFAPLHNVSTLTNSGLFQSNTTAPHTNTGFTNNGIIAYPQGNPIPNVTNNEIIISPTTFNGCSNISPAFTLGTPLDMTVLGVFTDAAATMSAGSYATATNTFTPTATLAVGTYNFFVKIQDGSGGCTRVVPWQLNLQDMTPPSITCPNDIPCVEATSPAGAVVFYSNPTTTDNCAGNVSVNAVLPSGSTFFVGINTVVATAFDSQGNSAICAFTVQVCDRTPPTIQNTPNNIPCVAATSPSGAVVTYTNPTATDIVSLTVPVTCVPASGSVFPIGSTTVVCTAMDAFGNMASSSFVVSVDGMPPTITCPANATVPAGANCTAALASYTAAATANDDCTANPTKVQSPVVGTMIAGSQIVTLIATDGVNNSATCTFTVTVVDQTAPSITCPANATVTAGANCTAALASYTAAATANDNCTANPTKVQSPAAGTTIAGSQIVTLTATDGVNNSATCTFTVTVVDQTAPSITCPNDIPCVEATSPAGAVVYYSSPTATDNCAGNVPVNAVLPSGSTFFVGVNTVVATAFDSQGNSAICAFTVQVCDRTPPTIQNTPNNIPCVAATSPSGAVVTYTNPTATDIVDVTVPVTCVPASGSVFPIGSTTVVCTAMDAFGNMASSSFVVSVDGTPPTITCPANATVPAGANCTAALASYTAAATANDDCTANPTKVQSPVVGTMIAGSQIVTLIATDGANNSATCTFTVTVVDQTAPSITCPANATVIAGANCTASLASYTAAATANDNCTANPTKVQSPVSGTIIAGSQVVTLTATDGASNSATCTFTVTVVDQTAPNITCPANATVIAGANCTAALASYTAAATANDNCTANPTKVQSPVAGTTIAGSQIVTLTATDGANNSATCTFTVTVVDQTAPSITCPANTTVVAGANCTATLASYTAAATANDNCTANPTKVQSPVSGTIIAGSQIVTLIATDGANNSATCIFTVTVVDNTPPTVICKNFTANLNTTGTTSITTANVFQSGSDNCGNVNLVNVVPNAFTCANIGASTVVLTVSDGSSNTATCSSIVTVADATVPTIICPANIIRANDLNQCSASVVYATPIASDNCAGAVASHFSGGVSGVVFQKGTTTVVWRATDGVGLTSSCSFTITVNDTQKPNITCPANQTRSTDPGMCSAVVTYPTPKGTDNCGLPTGQPVWISGGTTPAASGGNSIATFQKGINTVIWRATDGAGLTNTCTFRVTVNDTEAPTLTCPVAINLFTATNTCSAVATYTNPTFTDNCAPTMGTAVRISGLVSGSAFPLGNSNVVFQATDAAGNTRRCTMVVTVTDNQLPVITCPAPVVVNGTGSPCAATVFYGSATASDNCAGTLTPFLVTGLASGSSFPVGVTTNTFRAVAPNGQSSSCSFAVTVNCGSGMGNTGTEVRDADLVIQQNSNLNLAIAPNPALSIVIVSIEGVVAGGGTLLVFDQIGRLVQQQVIVSDQRTSTLQVAEFAPGLYRVMLRTDHGMVTKTLVVVKE